MDPGPVPDELNDLSYIEEQLIARVHPIISLYKIKGHQYGYSGTEITFTQDVVELAKNLPHRITDLSAVCNVRAARVRRALIWLKQNNLHYEHIEISEENLSLLPDDGNVIDIVNTENENNADMDDVSLSLVDSMANNDENTDEAAEFVSESFVPAMPSVNQNHQILNVLNSQESEHVIDWPMIGKEPLSEFNTAGYICQAFPTLFPRGIGDLRDVRNYEINTSDYFKHLFRYHDGRFEEHPRFRYFAMNSMMRWHSIEKGNLYAKKNDELCNLTVEELVEKIKEDPKVINSVMYHCSGLRSTKAYWKLKAKELIEMIEQIGMPTLFFTLSAADLHWPGLFKMLAPDIEIDNLTERMRRDLVAKHPILADKYFSERVSSFLCKVLKPKYKANDYWYRIEYQHR
ncbi:3-ketoacyl-CoA thiolase, peroxisomal [Frankliniella fusca]|uniref:3-ketoacyl-CoA thiolase, peroxisomal n=1 Tax=Frankliniella fusca TaxID=407009 RepID=A0AAE1LK88_9NEOP|nr:3-ketoacyl-CoA thiolase, peroxisomal [Frankliniella fusca]